ncbi:endonuclease NucS domain-containing protein [Gemmatimonadota bacterium]
MKRYKVVDVSERQLEDLVRQAPDLIEEGLQYVDHQKSTDRGPLDVLLVDSGSALVIAELKVVESDAMLDQGIDYYDYIVRNVEGYARAYSQFEIDPTQPPRLFLLAPSFSVTLLNRIKWVNLPISLFTYQSVMLEQDEGDPTPVYKEVTFPSAPEPVEVHSIKDRLEYITDAVASARASRAIDEIKSWDPSRVAAEPIKYAISFKFSGRVLAYLEPRRKYFIVSTNDQDEQWVGYRVESDEDLAEALAKVRFTLNLLQGGSEQVQDALTDVQSDGS